MRWRSRTKLLTMSNGETPNAVRTIPTINENTMSWSSTRAGEPPKNRVNELSIPFSRQRDSMRPQRPYTATALARSISLPSGGGLAECRSQAAHPAAGEEWCQEFRRQRFGEIESLGVATAPCLE